MKSLLCLVVVLTVSSAIQTFDQFRSVYGKVYGSEEETARRAAIFQQNLAEIDQINSANLSWTAGVNEWSDLSWSEFQVARKLLAPQDCSATVGNHKMRGLPTNDDPSKDWRDAKVVTDVKNQGSCGSCWTFSSTGAIESAHAIKTGSLLYLSEQQLVDCADAFDNHGCNGGLPSHAFNYVHYYGGIQGEDTYPYVGKDLPCASDISRVIATVAGEVNFTEGSETELMDAVTNVGPVAIAFQVASDFSHYTSGVYTSTICKSGAMNVNHAVLAVGYGTDKSVQYWTVKNSWGKSWGESGYFRIVRNKNMCGLATCASYPIV